MSAQPKVLMLTAQLGYGGAETSFIRLANFLAQSMDVTVALFTANYGRTDYANDHEKLHATTVLLDVAGSGRLKRWWRRIRELRKLKASHTVCISFLSGPNLVNVLAGNRGAIVSMRGSRLYDINATALSRRIFQHLIDPFVYRRAARIVPVSPGLIHEIRCIAGATAAAKATAISPFVELATIAERLRKPTPAEYENLRGQPVIVAAGRLSVEKGYAPLIRVFREVLRRQPTAKLLLIGDGPARLELEELCVTLELPINICDASRSSVIFAGYQPDVIPLMKLAKVFVLSSSTEGFPNVLLEAMAAGLPVLAADAPWGARAILDPTSASNPEPYPTTVPRQTSCGILLPRIDLPAYRTIWAEAMAQALQQPTAVFTPEILKQFDVATIGNQWKQLIHDLQHHH